MSRCPSRPTNLPFEVGDSFGVLSRCACRTAFIALQINSVWYGTLARAAAVLISSVRSDSHRSGYVLRTSLTSTQRRRYVGELLFAIVGIGCVPSRERRFRTDL